MNELINSINTITNPQQAVEEYIGEQFIEWLMDFIAQDMQGWPITAEIKNAKPAPAKIKKFALQIFLSAEALMGSREGDPGFMRFTIANLSESDDPQAEGSLEILEKRRTDELIGHTVIKGIVHTNTRQKWLKLLKVIGISEEEIERAEPKEPTRNYTAELSDVYSTLEWQTAVGAFAAMDRAVIEEYKIFRELLKNNLSLSDKDLEVLSDHINSTQYIANTSHILDKVVFDKEAKELVWQGASRQMEIRQEFLKGLEKYLV